MKRKSRAVVIALFLLLIIGVFFIVKQYKKGPRVIPVPEDSQILPVDSVVPTPPLQTPEIVTPIVEPPVKKASKSKIPPSKPIPSLPAKEEPPPVEIHAELIPKDIEIIRFYYSQNLNSPGTRVRFDINGSGFTEEFEKMIAVNSGQDQIAVDNFKLVTPNQISGQFIVSPEAPTSVIFPQVLIQDKVVFRAPEPYAVVREGEVLNLIFTEMAENGRSGRFKVFTNLNTEMFKQFSIVASTPGISVENMAPDLPFVVEAILNIGWQVTMGEYDLAVKLGDKTIWERENIIRVIKPNVGQSGLVQKMVPVDGFHRPGDRAQFIIQGSGFQPGDVNLLSVKIESFDNFKSSFVFVAPGRMELFLNIPKNAPVQVYPLAIYHQDKELLGIPNAFSVVDKNWTHSVGLDPDLVPGGKSTLIISGRDLEKKFIDGFEVELDEPKIKIGKFVFETPERASASISAGPEVHPGDYWVKLTSRGAPVVPQFGSIIKIQPK